MICEEKKYLWSVLLNMIGKDTTISTTIEHNYINEHDRQPDFSSLTNSGPNWRGGSTEVVVAANVGEDGEDASDISITDEEASGGEEFIG